MKDPLIAAVLNFFFSGAGYLYAGVRPVFGWLLLTGCGLGLASASLCIVGFVGDFGSLPGVISALLTMGSTILFGCALAVDAYQSTRDTGVRSSKNHML